MEKKNRFSSFMESFTVFVSDYTRFQILVALVILVVVVLAVVVKKLFF